jgi:hypothetical protein
LIRGALTREGVLATVESAVNAGRNDWISTTARRRKDKRNKRKTGDEHSLEDLPKLALGLLVGELSEDGAEESGGLLLIGDLDNLEDEPSHRDGRTGIVSERCCGGIR